MANLNDLLAQRAALEKEIADAQREERGAAITKVRALMTEYGLSLADLSTRATAAGPRKSSGKVAAKYRNPASGDTWTGRGLKPKWLRAALENGADIKDFLI